MIPQKATSGDGAQRWQPSARTPESKYKLPTASDRETGVLLGDLGRSLKHADKALDAALEHAELLRTQIIEREEDATRDVIHAAEQSRDLRKENARLAGELEARTQEVAQLTKELERRELVHQSALKRERQRAEADVSARTAALAERVAALESQEARQKEILEAKSERIQALESKQHEATTAYHLDRSEYDQRLEEKDKEHREIRAEEKRRHEEELKSLSVKYEAERNERSDARGESVRLREMLEESQSRERGLEKTIEGLKGQVAKLERITLERENASQAESAHRLVEAQQAIDSLTSLAQESKIRLDSALEELASARSRSSHLEQEVARHKEELAVQVKAREELAARLQASQEQIQSLEQELSEIAEAHSRSVALARIGRED